MLLGFSNCYLNGKKRFRNGVYLSSNETNVWPFCTTLFSWTHFSSCIIRTKSFNSVRLRLNKKSNNIVNQFVPIKPSIQLLYKLHELQFYLHFTYLQQIHLWLYKEFGYETLHWTYFLLYSNSFFHDRPKEE